MGELMCIEPLIKQTEDCTSTPTNVVVIDDPTCLSERIMEMVNSYQTGYPERVEPLPEPVKKKKGRMNRMEKQAMYGGRR